MEMSCLAVRAAMRAGNATVFLDKGLFYDA